MTGAVLSRKPPQEKTATGLKNKKWVNPIYATSGEHHEEGDGKQLKAKGLVPAPQPKKQLTMAERRKLQIAAAKKQSGAKPETIAEANETPPVSRITCHLSTPAMSIISDDDHCTSALSSPVLGSGS